MNLGFDNPGVEILDAGFVSSSIVPHDGGNASRW